MFHLWKRQNATDLSAQQKRRSESVESGKTDRTLVLVTTDRVDEPLAALLNILVATGFRSQLAFSPKEALSLFVKQRPCIVLVDYDRCSWTKKYMWQMLTFKPQAKVIVLLGRPRIVPEVERFGVELILNKSENLAKLVQKIKAVSELVRENSSLVER